MQKPVAVDDAYHKRRKWVGALSLLALAGVMAAAYFWIGKPLLRLAGDPAAFRAWIGSYGAAGQFVMMGMLALQVVFGIIPGEPLELSAGYAFGAWQGLLLCLVGIAAGSALVFALSRRFGPRLVEAFLSRERIESLAFLRSSRRLGLLVFLLYLIPGTPKDALTYAAGLTPIPTRRFLLLTSVARIPSIVTSTVAGNALGEKRYGFAAIVAGITLLISLAGVLWYRQIARSERNADETPQKSA